MWEGFSLLFTCFSHFQKKKGEIKRETSKAFSFVFPPSSLSAFLLSSVFLLWHPFTATVREAPSDGGTEGASIPRRGVRRQAAAERRGRDRETQRKGRAKFKNSVFLRSPKKEIVEEEKYLQIRRGFRAALFLSSILPVQKQK